MDAINAIRAELDKLAEDAKRLARIDVEKEPWNAPSPSCHIFDNSIYVDVNAGVGRKASGCATTFDAAMAACREKVAEWDPSLLARTLGIEDAA